MAASSSKAQPTSAESARLKSTRPEHGFDTVILGVDPGTRNTGYAVIGCGHPRQRAILEAGVIRLAESKPLSDRLADLQASLLEVIERSTPDAVAVEDAFYHQNARTALVLGHARGVVLATCGRFRLPVHAYAPASVKQAIAGHGRASKEQIQLLIQAIFGLDDRPPADAADAMAIALCHAMNCATGAVLPISASRVRRSRSGRRWARTR